MNALSVGLPGRLKSSFTRCGGPATFAHPADAKVDAYWRNTVFQNRAISAAAANERPAEELESDDSGTPEDVIDEFFALQDELTIGNL